MFMTPASFENWAKHFEKKGYKTIVPAWPGHDAPVEVQRKNHPDKERAKLTLEAVVNHYRKIVKELPEKPILIGHSMGGLVAQLLLSEDLAMAAIGVDSAPPNGVISLKWSFLKSNWGAISLFADIEEPISLSVEQFHYAFGNTLSESEIKAVYEKHYVPESRRVGKGPTTDIAKIEFKKKRSPLLLIAGGEDHIIPSSLNRSNFEKYEDSPSITTFNVFPGRDHYICGEKGWEEVADFVGAWIDKNQ